MNTDTLAACAAILLLALPVYAPVAGAQSQAYKGWPGHDDISDLYAAFADPPEGYGNVPFYWWSGDSLDIDRLEEQLAMLSDASIDGLCVSYNHTHDQVADSLSRHGLDYDFIDYALLQKAVIKDAAVNVAGESYKVIVLADTRALHKETLDKIKEFRKTGGIADAVKSRILPDFYTESGSGRVLHRRIGDKDVYMVMDISSGEKMHFRAAGKVECWVAMDGSANALPVVDSDGNGTTLRYSGSSDGSMLIVSSPGEPTFEKEDHTALTARLTRIDGEWDIDIIPTMDNKWGDFRLPASDGLIGVEARAMDWSDTGALAYDIHRGAEGWTYSFETAPGTALMAFKANGTVSEILIDGIPAGFSREDDERYVITVPEINPGVSTVTVKAVPQVGCLGAAFFGSPVVLIGKPYCVDITPYIHTGTNHIEVLVYSTLSNHYSTIPSPYRGTPRAGLIGPVFLKNYEIN